MKCHFLPYAKIAPHRSPPSRGAWIEIKIHGLPDYTQIVVAPLAGGVD